MVCAYLREDNPLAKARGLSPVHTPNNTITAYCTSMHVHFVNCEIFVYSIGISLKGAISCFII